MIGDDDFTHVAEGFHGIISSLQEDGLRQLEEQHIQEREARKAIREQNNQGLTLSELSGAVLDSAHAKQLLDADLDKMQQDAAVAAKKEDDAKQLPEDRFPAPPITV